MDANTSRRNTFALFSPSLISSGSVRISTGFTGLVVFSLTCFSFGSLNSLGCFSFAALSFTGFGCLGFSETAFGSLISFFTGFIASVFFSS